MSGSDGEVYLVPSLEPGVYCECIQPVDGDPTHIALPAAKHAALMRVVEEAAIAVLRLEDARRNPLLAKAVSDYRTLTATATQRHGEAPRA